MRLQTKLLAVLLATVTVSTVAFAKHEDLQAAMDAAEQWLAVVDAGQYGQSWDDASSSFKEKITKQNWQNALNTTRTPLGKLESRQFFSVEYRTELPKAPQGHYFIIQYHTKFANGGPMVETVTPMLDKDGQWHVSGYYIKPAE